MPPWFESNKIEIKRDMKGRAHVSIEDLSCGHEYYFMVRAKSIEGYGAYSPPSNIILVEKLPPPGWTRMTDNTSGAYYYYNRRIDLSSWIYPTDIKYYLSEHIAEKFTNREIDTLKMCYDEEVTIILCITSILAQINASALFRY